MNPRRVMRGKENWNCDAEFREQCEPFYAFDYEIEKFHHGTLDAVCGNFAAASGRGSPFHSLGFLLTLTLALIYTVLMPTPIATAEYMKLSVSERIQLVEDIWDSIVADAPNTVDLSQAQKAELHRRVAAHRADPSTAVPWEQVRSKLFPSKP